MKYTQNFWEKAYKNNAPKMLGVCRRYVKDRDIAEDLMQEAFLIAMNKVESFKEKGSFEGWLRRIAVNSALLYLRQQKPTVEIENLLEKGNVYENMKDDGNIKNVIEQANFSGSELLEIIDCLPTHHKLVFNLYVLDNYSHNEIAEELNISPGTSKSHLARARKKIQQLLYENALRKNEEKSKRKRALLLFVTPLNGNYIDGIFKAKLSSFSIEPTKAFVFPKNLSSNLSGSIIKKSLFSIKLYLSITTGITVLATVFYLNSNSLPDKEFESSNIVKTDSLLQQNDTIIKNQEVKIDSIIKKVKPKVTKAKPVVIKRRIIKRKTVLIRDTIRIIDSTNVR